MYVFMHLRIKKLLLGLIYKGKEILIIIKLKVYIWIIC